MPEIVIAALLAALLVSVSLIAAFVPWTWILGAAVLVSGIGLAFGVPASIEYHLRLARALRRIGMLPARWWLHPTPHHDKLDERALAHVMSAFWVGVAGFVVSLVGCLLAVIALFLG